MSQTEKDSGRRILVARLAASGQWERVLATSREWLAEEPEAIQAHRYAAQACVNLLRYDEAGVHLRQVLASAPNDAFVHRLASVARFHLGRFKEADESIQRAISLNPEDSHNWYHLAHMCYKQGDIAAARGWIAKARELAPNDPDVLNLHAICCEDAAARANLLRETLALDPANAFAHNNLGSYYLDHEKDYARAENCFRQALTIDPGLAVARRNLFSTIKHRDNVYRMMCAPRDMLLQVRSALWGGEGKRNPVGALVGVVLWILLFRFVLGGLVLWFGLVWPMLKVYEFLVVGDLRAKAGEVGARRGGVLGYRNWPLQLRLGLFGLLLASFWFGLWILVFGGQSWGGPSDATLDTLLPLFWVCGLLAVIAFVGRKTLKRLFQRFRNWRRNRRLKHLQLSP
jgi:tetratricopeptide (TPR) repeat protein